MALSTFRYTVVQPADGSDFMVDLPVEEDDDEYGVWPTIVAGAVVAPVMCPDDEAGDRTTTQFRVDTLAPLPDGTVLAFIVARN